MVGYRNVITNAHINAIEFIRHSDGGVSELNFAATRASARVYQAFRWWGIGTRLGIETETGKSLSGIPMVGYRNLKIGGYDFGTEFIRHSDGVVSELRACAGLCLDRVYQAFRWWGIGT